MTKAGDKLASEAEAAAATLEEWQTEAADKETARTVAHLILQNPACYDAKLRAEAQSALDRIAEQDEEADALIP